MASLSEVADVDDRFDEFYRLHEPAVHSFLRGHVRSDTVAAEISSEVFSVAFGEFATIGALPDDRARRWLFQVARNKSVHAFRSEHRYRRLLDRAHSEPARPAVSPDEHVEAVATQAELVGRVHAVLAQLPWRHRRILELNAFQRMDGPDIARELRITQTAARLRLMRARRAFAVAYTARYGPTPFGQP